MSTGNQQRWLPEGHDTRSIRLGGRNLGKTAEQIRQLEALQEQALTDARRRWLRQQLDTAIIVRSLQHRGRRLAWERHKRTQGWTNADIRAGYREADIERLERDVAAHTGIRPDVRQLLKAYERP